MTVAGRREARPGAREDACDAVVIGGGVIGCVVAVWLAERGHAVLLLEREDALLRRASYSNQARVHNGYHYPRSILTGVRSRVNFPRFVADYASCIDSGFEKYYAVARRFSKVTADQFSMFCRRIGAELAPAPDHVRALFDAHYVEDVYRVREYAFDADALRDLLRAQLERAGVDVRHGAEALEVAGDDRGLRLRWRDAHAAHETAATHVFNCTYSRLNELLDRSGLPLIPLRHELTEMALVRTPAALRSLGVTLMCGPFFSCMPFPARALHTLSHVRYTPHRSWSEGLAGASPPADFARAGRPSNFERMRRDAARYLPLLADAEYVDSLWEVKTVLPSSDENDSRPILFRAHHGLRNLTCILGGKIDNIYDVLAELEHSGLAAAA